MDIGRSEATPQNSNPTATLPQDDSASAALVLAPSTIDGCLAEIEPQPLRAEMPQPLLESVPAHIAALPIQLDVRIPLSSFRLGQLRALVPGTVLETEWPATEDLPFGSGNTQLLWIEFEVVDLKLAARITRVA